MSHDVTKRLTISTGNVSSYLGKDSGSIQIGGESYGYDQICCVGLGASSGNAKLNATGMAELYPNTVCHPKSLYASMEHRVIAASGSCYFSIDGTNILSNSVGFQSDYSKDLSATVTSSVVTSSTRQSSFIFHCQKATSLVGHCSIGPDDDIILETTFTAYDFTASAGTGIASASVSAAAGFNGDTVTFTASCQNGYAWDGWYSGSTKVSGSQTYVHTVNGSDLNLTAKAIAATKTVTVKYNGTTLSAATQILMPPIAVLYGGTQIASVASGVTKTLNCNGKVMSGDVVVGGKTLNCKDKKMNGNITVTVS